MPVAQCQVVDVGSTGSVGGDLVLGFALRTKIADRTMGDANPQASAGRRHAVEQIGWIVQIVPVRERRRQQPNAWLDLSGLRFGEDGDGATGALAHTIP